MKAVADGYPTVMHAAVGAKIPGILGKCGGYATCGTCHVYDLSLNETADPQRNPQESEVLASAEALVLPSSRLACQIDLQGDRQSLVFGLPSTAS